MEDLIKKILELKAVATIDIEDGTIQVDFYGGYGWVRDWADLWESMEVGG